MPTTTMTIETTRVGRIIVLLTTRTWAGSWWPHALSTPAGLEKRRFKKFLDLKFLGFY